jgi:cyclophilin family peptidyl-prolyl cis-trans isomerase
MSLHSVYSAILNTAINDVIEPFTNLPTDPLVADQYAFTFDSKLTSQAFLSALTPLPAIAPQIFLSKELVLLVGQGEDRDLSVTQWQGQINASLDKEAFTSTYQTVTQNADNPLGNILPQAKALAPIQPSAIAKRAFGITNVNLLNAVPTNLTLSSSTVNEKDLNNVIIGSFTTTDPDSGNTFTYSLVSGTGSTDNAFFTIQNNQLKANSIFDYETKSSYSIRVRTTDQSGLLFEKQLTIAVNDLPDPVLTNTINNVVVNINAADTSLNLSSYFDDPFATGRVAHFNLAPTSIGTIGNGIINVALYDQSGIGAPLTTQNFQNYVNKGNYTYTFIHRSVPGFIIQGGGYTYNNSILGTIPSSAPVQNEFNSQRSNLRGTIAMAKLGSDPNSATNQWFFNLADNSSNLNNQNGGFTVFGRAVSSNDLATIDAIAAVPVYNASGGNPSSPFTNLPLTQPAISDTNFIRFSSITVTQENELQFSVVSNSKPTLVTPTINNQQLVLDYLPNQTGSSTITIRATNLLGEFLDQSFTVKVLPTISINDLTVIEGQNPTAVLTLTLSSPSTQAVTVTYTTVNQTALAGSDYTTTTGTVSFAANQTSQTLSVPILNNDLNEANETFAINLSSPTNATIADSQGLVTISDTLNASVTTTLPAQVENLTLTGTTAINGTGNSGSNILTGNSANNVLNGGDGNDTLNGGAGNDTLIGGLGNDIYQVDSITDVITENANEGTDTIQSSVTYTIASLANIENLTLTGSSVISGTGNAANNSLTGNTANNTLNGGDGNDTLNGGAGNDSLIGGNGNDFAYYYSSTATVTVNLATGIASDGLGGTDTLSQIENVQGSNTAGDNITGNAGNNVLYGYGGNDTLNGGDGNDTLIGGAGNDLLTGGNGTDTAYYYSVTGAVTANLTTGTANDGEGGTDTLSQIENIQGSNTASDNLTGNTGVNVLYGYGGADILTGGLGNDSLYVGSDTVKDTVNYTSGDGVDTVYNFVRGASGDVLKFTGITAIDVQISGTSTLFKVGDGISGNSGFGTGTLLLTTSATSGFGAVDVNVNLLGATFAFS